MSAAAIIEGVRASGGEITLAAEVEVPDAAGLDERLHVCTSVRGDTQINNSSDPMVEDTIA
jgi:hypothetical protein